VIERLIEEASGDRDVLAVMLYGSQARGDAAPGSDTDICLVLDDAPRSPLALSQKKLAYLALGDLDVQVFQQLPLYVRQRVLAEGRVLHAKDVGGLYDVAFRTVREFENFRHEYDEYLQVIARAGS
jgi:uncharacterized protein